jgi:hypothetical protein
MWPYRGDAAIDDVEFEPDFKLAVDYKAKGA